MPETPVGKEGEGSMPAVLVTMTYECKETSL